MAGDDELRKIDIAARNGRGPVHRPYSAVAHTGAWLVLATIAMIFPALKSAMMVRLGSTSDGQHIPLPLIVYVDTILLIASVGTLAIALVIG